MKKLLLCFLTTSLLALDMGNPFSPELPEEGVIFTKEAPFSFKVGYLGGLTFDRKMRQTSPHGGTLVPSYSILKNGATLNVELFDRIEFYTVLGTQQQWVTQFPRRGTTLEYATDKSFFWQAGAREVVAYWKEGRVAIDFKWMQSHLPIDWMTVNQVAVQPKRAWLLYNEWQVEVGFAYHIERFVPYFGVSYSRVVANFHQFKTLEFLFPQGHFKMKNRLPFGLAIGCGLDSEKAFEVNLEVRCVSENAATLSADVQF
jgi:hypothetical protein